MRSPQNSKTALGIISGVCLIVLLGASAGAHGDAGYRATGNMPDKYVWPIAVSFLVLALSVRRLIRIARKGVPGRLPATRRPGPGDLGAARALTAQLAAGQTPAAVAVWDLVLQPGETAQLDVTADYARFYGGDGRYYQVGGVFVGRPENVAAAVTATALLNLRSRKKARANLKPVWREQQTVRVVVTDRRLMCRVGAQWLEFAYSQVTGFRPEPAAGRVTFEFGGTSPMLLSGPAAPVIAVHATWRLQGVAAVQSHPALAVTRG